MWRNIKPNFWMMISIFSCVSKLLSILGRNSKEDEFLLLFNTSRSSFQTSNFSDCQFSLLLTRVYVIYFCGFANDWISTSKYCYCTVFLHQNEGFEVPSPRIPGCSVAFHAFFEIFLKVKYFSKSKKLSKSMSECDVRSRNWKPNENSFYIVWHFRCRVNRTAIQFFEKSILDDEHEILEYCLAKQATISSLLVIDHSSRF